MKKNRSKPEKSISINPMLYHGGEKPSTTEPGRPNPCLPDDNDNDCHCSHPKGTRELVPVKRPPRKRGDDCCNQIIDMLTRIPGLDIPKPRKPKTRPTRKVQDLCASIGIKDAILPGFSVLWDRYRAKEKGRNKFENDIVSIFSELTAKQKVAMDKAFDGYKQLRKSGKGECLFNDCLADAIINEPVEKNWIAEIMVEEGLRFAGQTFFSGSGGIIGPGQIRLWDNTVNRGPNGSAATIYQGPWPWLTAICPNVTSYEEYGNKVSFRPIPGGSHMWQNYQYAQSCSFNTDSSGKITATCERQHPPPSPPGSLTGSTCDGGFDYTHGNDCLKIPAQRAGGSIKLKGFNFITKTVKVRITNKSNPAITFEQDCAVWGDNETPLKDQLNHFIVDERVNDWVDVPIPAVNPIQPGAPLPTGIYSVSVTVENVTNAIFDSGIPPVLVTNSLLLRIEANPDVKYLLWSDKGRCNTETWGLGSDEIWFDAFVGHMVPDTPVPSADSSGFELKTEQKEFPRDAWGDMDGGEAAGTYKRDIFGPKAFELYGVAVIAILGFEVDSETMAKEQVKDFGEAFWHAFQKVATVVSAGDGLIDAVMKFATDFVASIVTTVLVFVAAIVLVALIFWAAWAPADLMALDIFSMDALASWDYTDPKKGLAPENHLKIGDVEVIHRTLPKIHKSGDAAATWVCEHEYNTPETEEASYVLEFKLART